MAGPTCDSDDAYLHEHGGLVHVPKDLASGDPVWVMSSGAYAISYMTLGFNGFDPLPYTWTRAGRAVSDVVHIRHITEADWDGIVELESRAYTGLGLSEGRAALRSRAAISPGTCFVLDVGSGPAGYLLALPYPALSYPDLERTEEAVARRLPRPPPAIFTCTTSLSRRVFAAGDWASACFTTSP